MESGDGQLAQNAPWLKTTRLPSIDGLIGKKAPPPSGLGVAIHNASVRIGLTEKYCGQE